MTMWSSNGVSRHKLKITHFLNENQNDIMLLVETHLASKYNFQIRGYRTDHPDGKAHGLTGILFREGINHHFATNYLQATSVKV